MHRITPFFLGFLLLLSACGAPSAHEGHEGRDTAVTVPAPSDFSIEDESMLPTDVEFTVKKAGKTFTDFGVSHTKEMHLIIIRQDLRQFHHVHPKRDEEGVWHVAFDPEFGGTYRFYADFVDGKEASRTLSFVRTYAGETGEYGIEKDPKTRVVTIDGYTFTMEDRVFAGGVQFNYEITDAKGKPVAVETYLGEKGHSVLLSPSGAYVHVHPHKDYVGYNESDQPVFVSEDLTDPFYRVFTQFQIAGKVYTVQYDWQRPF